MAGSFRCLLIVVFISFVCPQFALGQELSSGAAKSKPAALVAAQIEKLKSSHRVLRLGAFIELRRLKSQFGVELLQGHLKVINQYVGDRDPGVSRQAFLLLIAMGSQGLNDAAFKLVAMSAVQNAKKPLGDQAAIEMTPLALAFVTGCSQWEVSSQALTKLLGSESPLLVYCVLLAINARMKQGDLSVVVSYPNVAVLANAKNRFVQSMGRLLAKKLKKFSEAMTKNG